MNYPEKNLIIYEEKCAEYDFEKFKQRMWEIFNANLTEEEKSNDIWIDLLNFNYFNKLFYNDILNRLNLLSAPGYKIDIDPVWDKTFSYRRLIHAPYKWFEQRKLYYNVKRTCLEHVNYVINKIYWKENIESITDIKESLNQYLKHYTDSYNVITDIVIDKFINQFNSDLSFDYKNKLIELSNSINKLFPEDITIA